MIPSVAIIDYGLGNLSSVKQACQHAGLDGQITSDPAAISHCDAIILPGVGAFGDAMHALKRLDLISCLLDFSASGRPTIGICLGMQLFMSMSMEFGDHSGLGLIKGKVLRFQPDDVSVKVPQIGWNHIWQSRDWDGTACEGLEDGTEVYFVHSYYVQPDDPSVTLSTTEYANKVYCSTLQQGNVFGCQYHPERSAHAGLLIYRNIARWIHQTSQVNRRAVK